MTITVKYHAQARQAAGAASEEVELPFGGRVRDLAPLLAARHGGALRAMLITDDGRPHPSVLLFLGDEQVDPESNRPLCADDVVEFLTPIAGG